MKDYKPKDHTLHRAKNLSFFASIFSLFIYICVFYIFNLSPYDLVNNNIFWFFMSNTLIIIIVADYGAFSSSNKKKQDLYEEYVKHSSTTQPRNYYVSPSLVPKYDEQVDKQCIIPKKELHDEILEEEKKETISDQNKDQDQIVPERVLEIVVQNQPKKARECAIEKKLPKHHLQAVDDDGYKELHEKKAIVPAGIYRRSKSDRHNRAKHVVIDERRNSVRRCETMKVEPKVVEEEEESEFSKMTNEDLNRRVEEFIQKFNRQIRLQATRNQCA